MGTNTVMLTYGSIKAAQKEERDEIRYAIEADYLSLIEWVTLRLMPVASPAYEPSWDRTSRTAPFLRLVAFWNLFFILIRGFRTSFGR